MDKPVEIDGKEAAANWKSAEVECRVNWAKAANLPPMPSELLLIAKDPLIGQALADWAQKVCELVVSLRDDAAIGEKWRTNSSLEAWFPFTAEELARLKAELTADAGMERAAEICDGVAKIFPRTDVSFDRGYAMGAERCAREIRAASAQVNAEGRPTRLQGPELSGCAAPSAPDAGQVVVPEFTIDQFNRAAIIVGTMDGYEGASPDADHFNWLNAMLRAAGSRHE